ncbi:hypothetical protein [Cryptosporangium aurantiacum]|uniref:Uncharacterized protein n=1 Tax=Cryptosporangium aurantiacum TaxID=134849 RepID=A0A1M7RMF9_9ACTN|nr:hypothetical protein [Cryptosporangium aurantiacum]SHN47517.1 hypothetical protein SAMN05443668_12475 [Cryptosporangium aurantiacum]
MRFRRRAALLAVLAVAATACDDEAPRAAPSPSRETPSAGPFTPALLRLPRVAPGEQCPTTSPQRWTKPFGVATNVLGDGPLYPIADYFMAASATLDLRPDDRTPGGAYDKKVRWLAVGYVGPVLIRADRIDGTGSASAQFSYTGTRRDGGYFAELSEPENDLPATTTVSGPGCFAYQIDGTSFSTTIVFRAVPAG